MPGEKEGCEEKCGFEVAAEEENHCMMAETEAFHPVEGTQACKVYEDPLKSNGLDVPGCAGFVADVEGCAEEEEVDGFDGQGSEGSDEQDAPDRHGVSVDRNVAGEGVRC